MVAGLGLLVVMHRPYPSMNRNPIIAVTLGGGWSWFTGGDASSVPINEPKSNNSLVCGCKMLGPSMSIMSAVTLGGGSMVDSRLDAGDESSSVAINVLKSSNSLVCCCELPGPSVSIMSAVTLDSFVTEVLCVAPSIRKINNNEIIKKIFHLRLCDEEYKLEKINNTFPHCVLNM